MSYDVLQDLSSVAKGCHDYSPVELGPISYCSSRLSCLNCQSYENSQCSKECCSKDASHEDQ
jgi:Pyruvate-formate lyase-activating enzyme